MLSVGDCTTIEINNFAHDGSGIGRINGLTVFVPRALPGEQVEVKIIKVKRKFARAELISIVQASEERIEPNCPHAEYCGGCQLQHLRYQKQLEFKRNAVSEAFARLGKMREIFVRPVLGMDNPWQYRNKAQFHVGLVEGKLRLGFFSPNSHQLVAINNCHLLPQDFSFLAKTLEDTLEEFGILPYDSDTKKGCLKHVVIKRSHAFGEMMVIFVTASDKLPYKKELLKVLQTRCPQVVSWVQNINSSLRQILGRKFQLLAGQSRIKERLGILEFLLSPPAFFQVNSQQAAILYKKAVEYADLSGKETVFDLYCGTGTLSLFLAQKARHVYGIESIPQAIEDAEANAKLNNIDNIKFQAGKVETILPQLASRGVKPDVVVLDPPRQGADPEVLKSIVQLSPQSVVYVSCDPGTLARDLSILHRDGYKVLEAQPVDMFPQTYHVETVCLMSKK